MSSIRCNEYGTVNEKCEKRRLVQITLKSFLMKNSKSETFSVERSLKDKINTQRKCELLKPNLILQNY